MAVDGAARVGRVCAIALELGAVGVRVPPASSVRGGPARQPLAGRRRRWRRRRRGGRRRPGRRGRPSRAARARRRPDVVDPQRTVASGPRSGPRPARPAPAMSGPARRGRRGPRARAGAAAGSPRTAPAARATAARPAPWTAAGPGVVEPDVGRRPPCSSSPAPPSGPAPPPRSCRAARPAAHPLARGPSRRPRGGSRRRARSRRAAGRRGRRRRPARPRRSSRAVSSAISGWVIAFEPAPGGRRRRTTTRGQAPDGRGCRRARALPAPNVGDDLGEPGVPGLDAPRGRAGRRR